MSFQGRGAAVYMLQFPARTVRSGNEVRWVLVAENGQRIVKLALLYATVGSEIFARGIIRDQVATGEEGLRTRVVAGGEVNLREPESVVVVVYCNYKGSAEATCLIWRCSTC